MNNTEKLSESVKLFNICFESIQMQICHTDILNVKINNFDLQTN